MRELEERVKNRWQWGLWLWCLGTACASQVEELDAEARDALVRDAGLAADATSVDAAVQDADPLDADPLDADPLDPGVRARLSRNGALVRLGLVDVDDGERAYPSRTMRVPDRVVSFLLGEDAVDPVVEPYLLQLGFVIRTRQGRQATAQAFRHLGLTVPQSTLEAPQQASLF